MADQNFVDYVKIFFRSGAGGAGSVHFLRQRGNPFGGPDGGNGGRGGHIILRGNQQLWTLLHLKYRKHIHSDNGQPGSGNNRTGADGQDIIVDVPLGTLARDAETGGIEFEITRDGEEKILLPGGRGGMGNTHFKSSTLQAPKFAQPGEEGLEGWKILELKVLADVGLVGFPNAGKSTLLAAVTAAKPKIANYAFTTLVPNLGIVAYRDSRSFVMADIPGIIEGAHEGRGLGHQFLKHIERNAILLFLIPGESDDIKKEFAILLSELGHFNPELLDKPRILAISKADLLDQELKQLLAKELPEGIDTYFISAVTGEGIQELKDAMWKLLESRPNDEEPEKEWNDG